MTVLIRPYPASATTSLTGISNFYVDCSAGQVVSSTHRVQVSGSAHATVPVAP